MEKILAHVPDLGVAFVAATVAREFCARFSVGVFDFGLEVLPFAVGFCSGRLAL
jgi:hypothetical protein